MTAPLSSYAAEIYLRGLGGEVPAFPTDPSRLEEAARAVLTDGPFSCWVVPTPMAWPSACSPSWI